MKRVPRPPAKLFINIEFTYDHSTMYYTINAIVKNNGNDRNFYIQ